MDGYIIGGLIMALIYVSGCWWNERIERIAAEYSAIRANRDLINLIKKIRDLRSRCAETDEHANSDGWGTK